MSVMQVLQKLSQIQNCTVYFHALQSKLINMQLGIIHMYQFLLIMT